MVRSRVGWALLASGMLLLAACTAGGPRSAAQPPGGSAAQSSAAAASAAAQSSAAAASAAAQASAAAAQRTAACQQYCAAAGKDGAGAAAACPDPADLGGAACRAWVAAAAKLLSRLSAQYGPDLSGDAAADLSTGLSDLGSFNSTGCAGRSAAAAAGKGGASGTLVGCEQSVLHAGAALTGLRATIGTDAQVTPPGGPVSPAAYRAMLAQAVRSLDGVLDALAGAGSNAAYSRDLLLAEADASAAADELGDPGFTPPPGAADANKSLTANLAQLATDLAGAYAGAKAAGSACGDPANAAAQLLYLGEQPTYRSGLPGSIETLDRLGYHVPLALPALPGQQDRRPVNGTLVNDVSRGGAGTLSIDNSGGPDTVVSLATGSHPAFTVFVRANSSATVDDVSDGTYGVYLMTGADWDQARQSFTRNCGYQKFDQSLDYTTTATQYTTYNITLTPVVGGNVSVSNISPADFPH